MTSSFNAFGSSRKEYGNPSVPVWLGKEVHRRPVGGSLASAYLLAGAKYAAGTPVLLNGKTLKPFIAFEVTAFAAGDGTTTTVDTITIKPFVAGGVNILPAVNDFIQKLGATFATTGKAAKVASVAAGATEGTYDVTVAHSATIDTPQAGDYITFSAATAAGSSKSIAVIPNGYLFNDIYIGDIDVEGEMAGASGAVVSYDADGILIKRTPAAPFAELMAAVVPGVLQVNY